ncbi:MAG: ABC transporter permease [Gemmatimonadales bacterium]
MIGPKRPRWLAALARLVPEDRRGDWLREWHAELTRIAREAASSGAPFGRRIRVRLAAGLGAFEDALGMGRRARARATWLRDLRVAARGLWRSPSFTLVAVTTLALGIGANAAIYSVTRSALLRPLPFRAPEQLVDVRLSFQNRHSGAEHPIPASEPEFLELRADLGVDLAGYWTGDVNLGGAEQPLRVSAAFVTANFLDLLGAAPALGRGFRTGEDLPGNTGVVVLSHGLWIRAFAGDPGAVGREVTLNGRAVTVVGVLPEAFVFPERPVDLLQPNPLDPVAPGGRSSHYLTMIGRLEPGSTIAASQARATDLAARWSEEYPGRHGVSPDHPVTLVSLRESMVGEVRASLLLLLGVVGLVLLIASANVASLVLMRIEHRQPETELRLALGAGARGVARPFLAESAILAVVGAALGLAVAAGAIGVLERFGPAELTRLGKIRIDLAVLGFTVTATGLACLVFGLMPVASGLRAAVAGRLRDGVRTATGGTARARLRQALVVTEITLAVLLVIGAGLLIKSFAKLRAMEPGFDPAGVVTMDLSLNSTDYPDAAAVFGFHEALAERLERLPGVVAAGAIRVLPFTGTPGLESMKPADRAIDPDQYWNAQYQVVSPGTLEALGVPLLEGRGLTPSDRPGAPAVALVNRAMADEFWPGASPIGRTVKFGTPSTATPVLTIVGVVGDVRQSGYRAAGAPQIYLPRGQASAIYGGLGTRFATLVVRSALPPAAAMAALREVVRELDPRLPIANLSTMSRVMAGSVTDERFLAGLVAVFSGLALTLGAVGVGGIVAYAVERRTRELGLRIALGAGRSGILLGILRGALGLAVAGALGGTLLGLATARLLERHLFGVGTADPTVFLAAPLVLTAAALGAALLPAVRATRIDPIEAMRVE